MSNRVNTMINPPIVELLGKVDNRYSLIIATAKRARQIIGGDAPLVDANSTKPLTVAINEISDDAFTVETVNSGIK